MEPETEQGHGVSYEHQNQLDLFGSDLGLSVGHLESAPQQYVTAAVPDAQRLLVAVERSGVCFCRERVD